MLAPIRFFLRWLSLLLVHRSILSFYCAPLRESFTFISTLQRAAILTRGTTVLNIRRIGGLLALTKRSGPANQCGAVFVSKR